MIKKLFVLSLLLISQLSFAQDNRLTISADSEIELPADQVLFTVNLSYRDNLNMKVAFTDHKRAEDKLVKFLKSLKINSTDIKYSLIEFDKRQEYLPNASKANDYFATSQTIQFKYSAFDEYSDILIKLVNAGYTDVHTQFFSSREKEFNAEILSKAINNAKQKAEVLARVSDRRLGKVMNISDTIMVNPVYRNEIMAAKANNGFINDFPQTIKKTYTVNVTFELL